MGWLQFREGPLSVYGGYFLLGVIGLLVLFFLVRGRIKIGAGRSDRARLAARYRELWALAAAGPPRLFAGTREALAAMAGAGTLLAVATGMGRRGLDQDLHDLDLRRVFDATRCAGEAPSKPHPAMLQEVLEELAVQPADALMVGDSEYDMAMARAAGVAAVGVRSAADRPCRPPPGRAGSAA